MRHTVVAERKCSRMRSPSAPTVLPRACSGHIARRAHDGAGDRLSVSRYAIRRIAISRRLAGQLADASRSPSRGSRMSQCEHWWRACFCSRSARASSFKPGATEPVVGPKEKESGSFVNRRCTGVRHRTVHTAVPACPCVRARASVPSGAFARARAGASIHPTRAACLTAWRDKTAAMTAVAVSAVLV
jgi:hypothetical protein